MRPLSLLIAASLALTGCFRRPTVPPVPVTSDGGCLTDSTTVARVSRLVAGAADIPCRPWDIGTGAGVQGYVWEAPDARAVLLLQHGYSGYSQAYAQSAHELIAHLVATQVTVYAFDFPGHGRSLGSRGVINASAATDLHLAARRKLRLETTLPVFLFGHSLGGLVTATSVMRDSSNVSGVILDAALLHDDRAIPLLRGVVYLLGALIPKVGLTKADLSTLSSIPEEIDKVRNDPLVYHGKIPSIVAASSLRRARRNWKHYSRWNVPVLLLHGTADKATDPDGSRRFHAMIPARDNTLHLFGGGKHALLDDVRRDATLRAILTWVEFRLPRGSY